MDLTSQKNLKKMLQKHNLKPIKKMGQNFLINIKVISSLLSSAELKEDDLILEIGSGVGSITKEIAKKARKVIAVEKDRRLIDLLRENLNSFNNVEIINEDIRDINPPKKSYKIISNLPFYLTGVVTKDFLEIENKPELISVIMQKEMMEKVCAKPPNMSLPAVSVQFYGEPEKIKTVPKNYFWPPPKVDGGILKITLKDLKEGYDKDFQNFFFKIVKAGFKHKRKQLANNLAGEFKKEKESIKEILSNAGLKENQRAEELTVKEWILITKKII